MLTCRLHVLHAAFGSTHLAAAQSRRMHKTINNVLTNRCKLSAQNIIFNLSITRSTTTDLCQIERLWFNNANVCCFFLLFISNLCLRLSFTLTFVRTTKNNINLASSRKSFNRTNIKWTNVEVSNYGGMAKLSSIPKLSTIISPSTRLFKTTFCWNWFIRICKNVRWF